MLVRCIKKGVLASNIVFKKGGLDRRYCCIASVPPDVGIEISFVKPPSLSINTRSKVLSFFSKILLRFFVLLLLLWLLLLLLPFPEDLLLLWWEGDCR